MDPEAEAPVEAEPSVPSAPVPPPAAPAEAGKYGEHWSPSTDVESMMSIFNTDDLESFERGGRQDAERIASYIGPASVVLDLGCGSGRVGKHLAPKCGRLWEVDASARMLEIASQRLAGLDNVSFARCHDTRIPDVPNGSVDCVFSFLVLQHLEREDAFLLLKEVRRIIKPDGVVLLTFPNLLSDVYLDSFVRDATMGGLANPVRARIYTPQEVERLLPAAGFSVDELTAETEIRAVCRPVGSES